jgi:hypothetical protein
MSNQSALNRCLREVVDDLDFLTAFHRVRYDSQFDFIQFPVEVAIFEPQIDARIQSLKDAIKQDSYTVGSLRTIWVPKRNYLLRPGSIPHLDDRIVFQALVDRVAPILEAQLSPIDDRIVFSSRLDPDPKSESMLLHPRDQWLSFTKRAVELCTDSPYLLVSDIASYFESIDLTLLLDTLTSSSLDPVYADAIHFMLSIWADGRTQGIPQMMAPCSFLANVYLSQVDKGMDRLGYNYIRYVDDIRVFVSSRVEGRQALLHLTEQLKRCYLDVQASKTELLQTTEHKDHLTALERHLVKVGIETEDDLSYFGDSGPHQEIPESKLIAFLENLMENPEYDDRHLRFCVNHLGHIGSPAARDKVLDELRDMPQESATFAQYLLKLPTSEINEQTVARIVDFFESEYCLYDWQTMWFLIVLASCSNITPSRLEKLSRIERLQQHYVNRAMLSYLLCSKGDLSFKREYISRYGQERSKEVQMAILCGVFELDQKERDRFYATAAGKDGQLDQLIDILIHSRAETIYLPVASARVEQEAIEKLKNKRSTHGTQEIATSREAKREQPLASHNISLALSVPKTETFTSRERCAMLEEELALHQRGLQHLKKQIAVYAIGEQPLHLITQIEHEEREIERIKSELARLV